MNIDGFPYIDDLVDSPLGRIISLAANDCGYTELVYYSMVEWVHPIFLKAKSAARKEDNPNRWEDMSGPFSD